MDFFTRDHLAAMIPGNPKVDAWYAALIEILPKYGITTPRRVAHFISQCAHESNNFRSLEENLNYSADALTRVFPRYFGAGKRDATQYARQPEKIPTMCTWISSVQPRWATSTKVTAGDFVDVVSSN